MRFHNSKIAVILFAAIAVITLLWGCTSDEKSFLDDITGGGDNIFYRDIDGDGYGNPAETVTGEVPPEGYVTEGGDCNDHDAGIHPGATDICEDGIDQDCNGVDKPCGDGGDGNVIHVPEDYPTIQGAITAAVDGKTIIVSNGTYFENINFRGKKITIRSAGGSGGAVINGSGLAPVVIFNYGEGSASLLDGFTIKNGIGSIGSDLYIYGGGILCYYSSPKVANCYITGNVADYGAGVYCEFSSPVFENCTISGNSATQAGGGIFLFYSSGTNLINCTINNNTPDNSGEYP